MWKKPEITEIPQEELEPELLDEAALWMPVKKAVIKAPEYDDETRARLAQMAAVRAQEDTVWNYEIWEFFHREVFGIDVALSRTYEKEPHLTNTTSRFEHERRLVLPELVVFYSAAIRVHGENEVTSRFSEFIEEVASVQRNALQSWDQLFGSR